MSIFKPRLFRDYLVDGDVKGLAKHVLRALLGRPHVEGTLSEFILDRLRRFDFYRDFANGAISREHFYRDLLRHEDKLRALGLPVDLVRYASRMYPDDRECVRCILEDLHSRGLIPTPRYDLEAFDAYRCTIRARFAHGCYGTAIFPEEERLIFALAQIHRPRRLIALGSYYGYWAIWALPAIRDSGGQAILIDLDPQVCALAWRNLRRMGFADCAVVDVADAIEYLRCSPDSYAIALLDAEGAADHPDPSRRGKNIYYPIARELAGRMETAGLLICHNIILKPLVEDPVVDRDIAYHRDAYRAFLPFVREWSGSHAEYETTQGIGIYKA
jgi:predicted O-methyltransferase YrrM